jgi:hypothetical protein
LSAHASSAVGLPTPAAVAPKPQDFKGSVEIYATLGVIRPKITPLVA